MIEKYSLVFIDEIYEVLMIMDVPVEKAELVQLKGVDQEGRRGSLMRVLLIRTKFKGAFLDRIFPLDMRDEKVL